MNYDYLTSAIKISVPNYTDSKTEPGTIYFNIELQVKDNKWSLSKRFSEFDALFNSIKTSYHNLPQLPKKSYLFKMNEKDLESRREGLQDFLRKIIIRNDLINCQLIKQFLQLDKNASEMMVNPPKLSLQYSIQGQTKGIRDLIFIDDLNIFLIATADQSPVNKLSAKVTNTKLPWEGQNNKFMEVGSIQAWQCDLQSLKFVKIFSKGYPQQVICISYDKVSQKIVVGLDDGVIDFIHMKNATYEDIVCDKVHNSRLTGLGYDSLSNTIFSTSQDKIFRISHGSSLALILAIPHSEPLLSFFKDQINKRVFIGTKTGMVYIYDVSNPQKPKLLTTLKNNKGGSIRSIHLDTNRNYLFTGSFDDGQINVFDIDKPGREKLAKLNATLIGKAKIRSIAWSAKRAQIMTGTSDGSITFWNAVTGKSIYVLQAFDSQITQLKYLPEKQILISSSKSKSIKIWNLPKEWRDAKLVSEQQKRAGKFVNQFQKQKLTNGLKNAAEDSDDDDLAGWHLD